MSNVSPSCPIHSHHREHFPLLESETPASLVLMLYVNLTAQYLKQQFQEMTETSRRTPFPSLVMPGAWFSTSTNKTCSTVTNQSICPDFKTRLHPGEMWIQDWPYIGRIYLTIFDLEDREVEVCSLITGRKTNSYFKDHSSCPWLQDCQWKLALTQEVAGQLWHIFLLGIGSTPKRQKSDLIPRSCWGTIRSKKSQDTHGWEAQRA